MTLPPIIYARGDEALDHKAGSWVDYPMEGLTPFVPQETALAMVAGMVFDGQLRVLERGRIDTPDELRALATADQNAALSRLLREAENGAYERAAKVAASTCLVGPDGNPTEDELLVCEDAYHRIMALITPAGAEHTG